MGGGSYSLDLQHKCYQKHNIGAKFMTFLHKCYAFDNIYVENGFLVVEMNPEALNFRVLQGWFVEGVYE